MIIYQFPAFDLKYNKTTGEVTTIYPDGCYSHVEVNEDHEYHSSFFNFDFTAKEFNLLHEITHQMLALAHGQETCPIVWAAAHNQPMPPHAQHLEWKITALSYFAMGAPPRPNHAHEWAALHEIAKFKCPYELKKRIYTLMLGCNADQIKVTHA